MESKLEAKIKTILLIALISQLAYAPTKKKRFLAHFASRQVKVQNVKVISKI